ncbi:branched-chain amino acid transport system II carrier protein [Cellulophaga baltica]|uniref:branched-chain amino acid transport system II carrier protein n=1 Tax=Cellulophaga TaxID=104264 RepID=UPI001C075546|nr:MULTISPECIES: branched-chain amino acid transport system II carrier protein [Cellulophaga]MBU2997651.1 branched-chain amino acid transport system II carrier protein [Cellulophaga baltica]MDO6769046.1 branched-chain amino acid transport system II carrier protein [Cellulophaga sp. 1_MG-2023]
MQNIKKTLVTSFALFSLFFGAGNLIFPPLLGFQSGNMWWLVAIGFSISAVIVPILGIFAHAKLQGTIFDFGKKVGTKFSIIYSLLIYLIAASLPSPRTASVTHEIAIKPFFDTPYLYTSIAYFTLVFLFAINRSKILNILGKILTPTIIIILLAIIGVTLFTFDLNFGTTTFRNPFSKGILEGYQTFDAIAAVVVGGVIIVSININNKKDSYEEKRVLIRRAGWLSGFALFLIYAGLIITGALMHNEFSETISRTELLNGISKNTLGDTANFLLSILVSLACFTTAVGVVTGTADFIKHLSKGSKKAFYATAFIGCLLGVVMGQFNVNSIIQFAVPALMFIYPLTIILILLNVVPEKYGSSQVFKIVVITTLLFSIPDFIDSIGFSSTAIKNYIPLSNYNIGWILPALLSFVIANLIKKTTRE